MFTLTRRCRTSLVAAPALLLVAMPAYSTNLMYLSGYGAESSLMGGADIAMARDTFATNNNPAGLSQLDTRALDLSMSIYHAEGATHTDSFGSYRRDSKNQDGAYGNFGYAQPLNGTPLTFGVGLVVVGGVGWVYKNMNTFYGTRDETTSLFSVVKLAPAMAWRVNDRLSLGATLGVNYISGAQTLFPNTSVDGSFFGINFKDASGWGLNAKLGLQYRLGENVMLGATYANKVKLDMKGGTLRANYSNWTGINQVVRYDDAKVEGFALPQEIGIGIAFRPVSSLLISMQEKWYDWSDALKTTTLTAKSPRYSALPASLQQLVFTSQIGALDQHVYSIGAAYDYSPTLTLMAGVNYGRRAVPEQNLSPSFQSIHQMHYMAGARYRIDDQWAADVGVERMPQQMVTYNNPATPFGPSVATHSANTLHIQLSRRWN